MLERKVEQKKSRHKENDIFKHNGKALIKINDILSLEYKNKTFRKWIKELEDANKYIEKQKEYIQQHKEEIIDFINYCGDHTDGNLKKVIDYLLQNKNNLKIFSGLDEIKLSTKKIIFRDKEFNLLHINNQETSITTEMGKDWKLWQAIREIYCNALDEEGVDFLIEGINPKPGETHFYIELKEELETFIKKFDNYFATKKEVLFKNKYGRILVKSGSEANIYRKGIRCVNSKTQSRYR